MAEEGVLTPLEITEEKELTPYPEIEYDVVMEASLEKFKRKINQMLEQGRQTEGGISAVSVGSGVRFYQAMIRWNVDGGPKPLYIPGLEDEPDLYEDVEKDADKTEGSAVEG